MSAAEIRNAPSALKSLDANGDGQLSADEVRPRFGGRGGPDGEGRGEGSPNNSEELVQTLMAFDKNHDAKISRDELPECMQGMIDRGDTDKDGSPSADEIRKMAAAQAPPSFELARMDNFRARRPYVAVWIEDADKFPVRTIAFWVEKTRYIPEIKAWYKDDRLRAMSEGTDITRTVSSATRPPESTR